MLLYKDCTVEHIHASCSDTRLLANRQLLAHNNNSKNSNNNSNTSSNNSNNTTWHFSKPSALPSCPCLSTSGTHAATQLVQSLWPEIGSFCLETRLTQLSFVSLKERKHVTCMRARRPCICGFMHRGRGREDMKKRRGEHDSMVTHTLYTACTMAHHLSNHANKTKQHQHKRAEGSTICRAGLLSTCDLNISCNDGT